MKTHLDDLRRDFIYAATGDYREQNSETDELSATLSFFPDAPLRISAGLDLWQREGEMLGGMNVSGSIEDTVMPFDDDMWNAWIQADWSNGPWAVSLRQAYREETLDDGLQEQLVEMAGGFAEGNYTADVLVALIENQELAVGIRLQIRSWLERLTDEKDQAVMDTTDKQHMRNTLAEAAEE